MNTKAHLKAIVLSLTLMSSFYSEAQSGQQSTKSEEQTTESEIQIPFESPQELLLEYELERTKNYSNGYKATNQVTLDNLEAISARAELSLPETFEGYYIKYKQSEFTDTGLKFLKRAELNTENKSELYTDFIASSHVLKKERLFDEYTNKLRSSGFITNEVLEYNKNVLRSIETNDSYIVTNGWEDTYPLLSLLKQENKTATQVINIEWLLDSEYRKLISERLGTANPSFNSNPYEWILSVSQSTSSSIYFTPTLPHTALIYAQNSLTPIGIVFSINPVTAAEQRRQCINAWKMFSKVELISNSDLSKNYILIFSILEDLLANDESEKGTLSQVLDYKKQLLKKYPTLK